MTHEGFQSILFLELLNPSISGPPNFSWVNLKTNNYLIIYIGIHENDLSLLYLPSEDTILTEVLCGSREVRDSVRCLSLFIIN